MTGCTAGGYDQLETSPETIEQELRPAVCERRQTDIFKENYSIDLPRARSVREREEGLLILLKCNVQTNTLCLGVVTFIKHW